MTTVREAFERYLAINGFSTATYTAPTVDIPIGPLTVPLPNTKGRQAIVRWHDLHHVVTGYGTDLVGEAEIGAWELRAGCTSLAAYVYNGMAAATGLVIAPLRTLRAFRDAAGCTTLYRLELDFDEALARSVGELRAMTGVPPAGMARRPARLHSAAPRGAASDRVAAGLGGRSDRIRE